MISSPIDMFTRNVDIFPSCVVTVREYTPESVSSALRIVKVVVVVPLYFFPESVIIHPSFRHLLETINKLEVLKEKL